MSLTHPAHVILDGWCPKNKEEYLFFKCVECNATYDEHITVLLRTGTAKCPLCMAHHHMSVVDAKKAMDAVKKLRKQS